MQANVSISIQIEVSQPMLSHVRQSSQPWWHQDTMVIKVSLSVSLSCSDHTSQLATDLLALHRAEQSSVQSPSQSELGYPQNKQSLSSPLRLYKMSMLAGWRHIYNFCVYSKTAGSVSDDSDPICIMRETLSGLVIRLSFDIRHRVLVCLAVFLLRDKVILPSKWWALFSWIILSFIILILVTTTFKSRPRTNLRRLFCFIEIVEISHFIANNVSVKSNVLRGNRYIQNLLHVRTSSRGNAHKVTFAGDLHKCQIES